MIINGEIIAAGILKKVKKSIADFKKQGLCPKLTVVMVGDDKPSLSFIKKKEKVSKEVGLEFEFFKFSKDVEEGSLINKIKFLQQDQNVRGVVVQLPLPKNINARKVIDSIDSFRDIDCLTSTNLGKLTAGNYKIVPPTAKAVLEILASQKIKLAGKNIVIVGRGDLVGKPLAILLTQEKNTVISCNKYTKNLSFFTKTADILISAAGKRLLIKESMVKKGVIAIDAGTSFYNGKICGDLDFLEIKNKAKIITPTPGGVGPMTVACLLDNLVFLTKHKDILS